MIERSSENMEVKIKEIENTMFQNFGDKHISEAIRLVNTKIILPTDNDMIHEALCIIIAMYMQKIKDGVLNADKVLH